MKTVQKIILFLLLFLPLSLQAQDVKMKKIQQEKVEADRDTLSDVEEDEEDEFEELSDSLEVDSLLPWPLYVTRRLERTLGNSPYAKGVNIGFEVYDLTADSLLYAYNEKKLLKPASNMKLFSGIAGLKYLGADCLFRTRLYRTGKVCQDTLYSVPDSIWQAVPFEERADSLGNPYYKLVKVYRGDFYGVGSYDPLFTGTDLNDFADRIKELQVDSIVGNFYSDESFRYSTAVSPLHVNKVGSFMQKLKDAVQKRGIKWKGAIGIQACPQDTLFMAEKSHTLRQIMNRMMKQSDNKHAENVYQRLNSLYQPQNPVLKLIKEVGYNPNDYVIADGSGLSHDNKVSAELEVAFLKYAKAHKDIYPTLYENLPIAGYDGTLRSRMKEEPTFKNVRAKTGTINGVITLGGYCTSATQHELAFAILLNDIQSSPTAKALEDELCTIMTHDQSVIPVKKLITAKKKTIRRRTPARKRKRKRR